MGESICKNCTHFVEAFPGEGEEARSGGQCHRYPPTPLQIRVRRPKVIYNEEGVPTGIHPHETEDDWAWNTIFPMVFGDWYCGEFSPDKAKVDVH